MAEKAVLPPLPEDRRLIPAPPIPTKKPLTEYIPPHKLIDALLDTYRGQGSSESTGLFD
jgi:hypothetical protein